MFFLRLHHHRLGLQVDAKAFVYAGLDGARQRHHFASGGAHARLGMAIDETANVSSVQELHQRVKESM